MVQSILRKSLIGSQQRVVHSFAALSVRKSKDRGRSAAKTHTHFWVFCWAPRLEALSESFISLPKSLYILVGLWSFAKLMIHGG